MCVTDGFLLCTKTLTHTHMFKKITFSAPQNLINYTLTHLSHTHHTLMHANTRAHVVARGCTPHTHTHTLQIGELTTTQTHTHTHRHGWHGYYLHQAPTSTQPCHHGNKSRPSLFPQWQDNRISKLAS